MAITADDTFNEYVECTVCGSDTPRLCSPCGDPICDNCACPNGCGPSSMEIDTRPLAYGVLTWDADAAA